MTDKLLHTNLNSRFWDKVDKSSGKFGPDGNQCWIWLGAKNSKGYGYFWWNGRSVEVHRLSYQKLVGMIPAGFHIDHLCGDGTSGNLCVNPSHLEPVTPDENTRRKLARQATRVIEQRHTVEPPAVPPQVNPAPHVTVLQESNVNDSTMVTKIPYCPWEPTPVQQAFLHDMSREAFYGGAAAGGKSVALLMAALQFIHIPGYAALLLRRTYADLMQPRALMDLAREWFGDYLEIRWNDKTATWRFPNNAKLKFGYLSNAGDLMQYQSAAYQFIGFDELTHFPNESDYQYLFSRNRRPSGVQVDKLLGRVPLRMRSASNPGGPGHKWVRDRFIVNGSLYGRNYYPAQLDDNIHIDQEEYDQALMQLPEHERVQLRYGDWFASPPGGIFQRDWVVPDRVFDEPPEGRWDWVRYWQLQPPPKPNEEPDFLAGALVGYRASDSLYCIADIATVRSTPHVHEELLKNKAKEDGKNVTWYIQKPTGDAGDDIIRHIRKNVLNDIRKFHAPPGSGDLIIRAEVASGLMEKGRIIMVEANWHGEFFDEADHFPEGPTKSQISAVSGAVARLQRRAKLALSGSIEAPVQENMWAS